MKHTRIILFGVVFLLFSIVGFLIIRQIIPLLIQKTANTVPTPAVSLFNNQGNYLFIRTDQLNSENPHLLSIWVAFISRSNPPSMIVKSIYPDIGSPEKSQLVLKSFGYSAQNGLSKEFIKALQTYDFQWDAYVILDNTSTASLLQWVNNNEANLILPEDNTHPQSFLDQEKSIFQQTCANLPRPDTERGPKPIWQNLIPDHMQTDLYLKDTIVNWERITLSTPGLDCKILVTP